MLISNSLLWKSTLYFLPLEEVTPVLDLFLSMCQGIGAEKGEGNRLYKVGCRVSPGRSLGRMEGPKLMMEITWSQG